MRARCAPEIALEENPGARLGIKIAAHACEGRDKLTFVISRPIAAFGDWVEQLIAESTGKAGVGIVPVVGESLRDPSCYGNDRVFVDIRLRGDGEGVAAIDELAQGAPVLRFGVEDATHLGAQIFLWEFAVAVAGHVLGVNPFDQPNVEESKRLAREMTSVYRETGGFPEDEQDVASTRELREFVTGAKQGAYIAVHAYVPSSPPVREALSELRDWIRDASGCATTVGFGPRFLHSTGQLHKGDGGNGRFVQLTCRAATDVPIPDEAGSPATSIGFDVLKSAQALGDARALCAAGRRLLRLDLGEAPENALRALVTELTTRSDGGHHGAR
ncbi:MAG: hypothetical protein JSW65_04020 [Candidatus Bipolaricaulota bacterium]|nr:MAG: hypothetical protein JSW65_04020 [Candidatus Bipolaricaulota bacterium]